MILEEYRKEATKLAIKWNRLMLEALENEVRIDSKHMPFDEEASTKLLVDIGVSTTTDYRE